MVQESQSNTNDTIIIFTDGASRGNPGPGGYGVLIVLPNNEDKFQNTNSQSQKVIELGGREDNTTNNRMEMRAVIEALRYIEALPELRTTNYERRIYVDSTYIINGITKWIHGWQKRGWQTKAGEPVKNSELWKELAELVTHFSIDWQLLEGHVGIAGNERADTIATAFADGKDPDLYHGPLTQYGLDIADVSYDDTARQQKQNSRSGRSGRAYSYISMVDGEIQTHSSWPECQKRVSGKDAWFRKAMSEQEEREIIARFRSQNV